MDWFDEMHPDRIGWAEGTQPQEGGGVGYGGGGPQEGGSISEPIEIGGGKPWQEQNPYEYPNQMPPSGGGGDVWGGPPTGPGGRRPEQDPGQIQIAPYGGPYQTPGVGLGSIGQSPMSGYWGRSSGVGWQADPQVQDTLGELRRKMSGNPGWSGGGGGMGWGGGMPGQTTGGNPQMVLMRAPNGQMQHVDRQHLQHFLGRGAQVVG